jgi:hypothetical protein
MTVMQKVLFWLRKCHKWNSYDLIIVLFWINVNMLWDEISGNKNKGKSLAPSASSLIGTAFFEKTSL